MYRKVIIISPVGDTDILSAAVKDCVVRGENPASLHYVLSLGLDYRDDDDRALAADYDEAWFKDMHLDAAVVYTDKGIDMDMILQIEQYSIRCPIEFRTTDGSEPDRYKPAQYAFEYGGGE